MRIRGRERRSIPSKASRAALAAALAVAVAACDAAPAEEPAAVLLERAIASSDSERVRQADETAKDCLAGIWRNQADANRAFDRANDESDGGTISCATGTSASQYDAVLGELRKAAAAGDQAALLRHVSVPLLYIDAEGDRHTIDTLDEAEAQADEIFAPAMLGLLARIDLAQMTVSPGEGGYFALGALWLAASREGGNPRIVTINRQALAEAAASNETASSIEE